MLWRKHNTIVVDSMFDFLPQYAVQNSIQQFQFHHGFFVWIQILRVHIWPSQDTMMFSLFLYFVNEVIMMFYFP